MALTRDQIISLQDVTTKEIQVPAWKDSVFIKKLTRGQQDEYARRRFTTSTMKDGANVESDLNLFGHDAWIVSQAVCDEDGKRILKNSDVAKLNEKDGETIGTIALEIVTFSGMREDIEELEKLKN